MAYIKERGNNNYFVRVSYGIMDNGRPFQKSRLFRSSKVNLPESKVRKELDAFVKALEEECRIEFESKHQRKATEAAIEEINLQDDAQAKNSVKHPPVLTCFFTFGTTCPILKHNSIMVYLSGLGNKPFSICIVHLNGDNFSFTFLRGHLSG